MYFFEENRMRPLIAVLLLAVAPHAAWSAGEAPSPSGPGDGARQPTQSRQLPTVEEEAAPVARFDIAEEFSMPSGNIGCIYIPEGGAGAYRPADGGPELSCDRVAPRYIRAVLGRSGRAIVQSDVGDRGCCGAANVIPYGEVWGRGPFTCFSERTGLRCERNDGHSFHLSRARVTAD